MLLSLCSDSLLSTLGHIRTASDVCSIWLLKIAEPQRSAQLRIDVVDPDGQISCIKVGVMFQDRLSLLEESLFLQQH